MSELAVYFEPYTFCGIDRPTGFRYCLRRPVPGPEGIICVEHGIVFGGTENILAELGEGFKGVVPIPAPSPIRHLGLCHLKPRPKEYSPRWPREPRKGAPALEWRIYRVRLESCHKMKRTYV